MKTETLAEFIKHAWGEYPREACGLILNVNGKERYFPCRNVATTATDFVMHPEDYANAEDAGEIMAVIHSHPNTSARASQADRVGCEGSRVPWHIVSIPGELLATIEPTGYEAPLVGRNYSHGVLDCYAVVRDWFRVEMNLELPDFDRDWEWWKNGGDLYMENFRSAGFFPVEGQAMRGDVFLMQIGSKTVNHAGVYLGGGIMLHHALNRLSCRQVYGGYWKKATRVTVRHKGAA